MLNKLRSLFSDDPDDDQAVDPQAAAAALMFEIVWADHDVSEAELTTMAHALTELFALDPARTSELVEEARRSHAESVGLYAFTRILNEQMSADAKLEVIAALWHIAFADKRIDRFEEHMIRRIAELLYVPHKDFIAAKIQVRDSRA